MEEHLKNTKPATIRMPRRQTANQDEPYYIMFMLAVGLFTMYVAWHLPFYHDKWHV